MKTVTLLNCVECGKPVEGRASYCSRACIQRAWRARNPRPKKGTVPITPKQARSLQARIRKFPTPVDTKPKGINRRRWKEILNGEFTHLTLDELKLLSASIPGALFALGMSVDRHA